MPRERFIQPANRGIISEGKSKAGVLDIFIASPGSRCGLAGPHAHQHVLHEGQLIRVRPHVIEETIDQGSLNRATKDRSRAFNGDALLGSGQARC